MLIVLLVIQSFLSTESTFQRAIFNLLFLGLVLSAIRTLSESRIRMLTAVTVGAVAYALSWAAEARPSAAFVAASYACHIVVFLFLVVALAENVFGDGPVDLNRIMGAVSIYLVLGLVWSLLYSLLEILQPGSFTMARHDAGQGHGQTLVSHFIYFSSVTLTTLGYGDIVPISRPARMFSTLEATIGQLYLAIVIARLVGLHISQNRK